MTKSKTLEALCSRQSELESGIGIAQAILFDGSRDRVGRLMLRFIKPRKEDLEWRSWSSHARARLMDFEAAMEAKDIMGAVKRGRLERPEGSDVPDPRALIFFHYVDDQRELAGLKEVLGWLASFEESVAEGDANKVLNSLAQLGVCHAEKCDCDEDIDEDIDSFPSLVWTHAHHAEFNRAAWEIIAAKDGLIDALRLEIQKDIDGPVNRIGRSIYGEIVARPYARELLKFFIKDRPSPKWVGDLASTAGVSAIAHEDAQAIAS